ncbi:MAG: hypothetical protein KJ601_07470, partial [Nanoarchaeota archaeon]|nr:hypothetical protein [Nanoarchaeota archaeon]
MLKYKKTPKEILELISLFRGLRYNLFKCDKIFRGAKTNLDVLFLTSKDYEKASKILEKNGFVIYMPERVEKFKRMYVKVSGGGLIAAHLHREVAWHGIKVLDKKQVFLRQIEDAPSIFVPSIEDRLLINSAHVIFENYILGEFERCLLKGLLRNKIDWDYVNCELKRHSFKKVFYSLMKALKSNPNKPEIIKANMVKILKCPSCIWHIGVKIIRRSLRVFSLRRHGCLIALVGVNGSGKTTLANQILSDYEKITDFFHGQYGYYFGWEPFLPTTKMLSKRLKKQNKSYYK